MDDTALLDLIRRALHEVDPERGSDWSAVELGATIDSLELDSIKTMEMIGFLEEEADVLFEDEDLANVDKLADLVALVQRG